jgi:hypothetical protein
MAETLHDSAPTPAIRVAAARFRRRWERRDDFAAGDVPVREKLFTKSFPFSYCGLMTTTDWILRPTRSAVVTSK